MLPVVVVKINYILNMDNNNVVDKPLATIVTTPNKKNVNVVVKNFH